MNALRPVMGQRCPSIVMPKLRKSAKDAPMCFACLRPNIDGNLVLAHNNWLEAGKGVGLKSTIFLEQLSADSPADATTLLTDGAEIFR